MTGFVSSLSGPACAGPLFQPLAQSAYFALSEMPFKPAS